MLGSALLALALTSAVLRRRLHDVDVVVGRAFVYAVLTALIALVYLAAVAAAGALGRELSPLGIGLLTGVAALALLPLRGRLQQLLDRALYGAARDPRVAVARLTEELAASRQQIVTAREEERSRLRRDLHDELGPTLAGLSMQLGDLREVVAHDPDTARDRLWHLESAARDALDGVRRVSRALRPPSLDELGLVGALTDLAAQPGPRARRAGRPRRRRPDPRGRGGGVPHRRGGAHRTPPGTPGRTGRAWSCAGPRTSCGSGCSTTGSAPGRGRPGWASSP